jgi:SAM-dependent methyltransferase
MSKYFSRFYPESRFGDFSDVDGTIRFYCRVRALLEPHFSVLDIGCGRGSYAAAMTSLEKLLMVYKGQAKHVLGIDPDPVGETNPTLDEFRRIEGTQWPVADCSIDLAVSDWTMEHVEDPEAFLRECHRVLKPGGFFCMRTANRLGYVVALSRLIPNHIHTKVLNRVQPDREDQDVFPTVYRCNTIGKLRHALKKQGFDACVYGHNPEPSYLGFSFPSYALGVLYQKLVPRMWGTTLFVYARKK